MLWFILIVNVKFERVKFSSFKGTYSKVSSLIRPEIKFVRAFMSVLVTSNFDDGLIKNERPSIETAFSHYKSMGNVLDAKGRLTP